MRWTLGRARVGMASRYEDSLRRSDVQRNGTTAQADGVAG